MHKEIEVRLRTPAPNPSKVVKHSTPILSFGPFLSAKAFSLGINPSNQEFVDRRGKLLIDAAARFETMKSLGVDALDEAPSSILRRIHKACDTYFERNPYRLWFDKLEDQLNSVGASYYDSSAAHVDLSQWATGKKWHDVDNVNKNRLLNDGRKFLEWQLSLSNVKFLLLNGRTVMTEFQRWSGITYSREKIQGPNGQMAEIVEANLSPGLKVIGWSTNLQSSRGVTREFREKLSVIVRDISGY